MFQEVGEFVVDNSGKHKLFLNSESIVWPYNLTAPSSGIPKCEACDEHCYNGEAMIIFFLPLTLIFPRSCCCAHSAVTPTETACRTACLTACSVNDNISLDLDKTLSDEENSFY